jgi:16S rRNA A1518/A1519 N6-dimethyltransferase RsmA/KsgA/DIM1 with predicted DNA glycosylase/AP lyase activity
LNIGSGPVQLAELCNGGSRMHKQPNVEAVEIANRLPERLEEAVNHAVEMSIVLAQILNFFDRMDHC